MISKLFSCNKSGHNLSNRQILIFVLIIAAIMISTLDIYIPASIAIANDFQVSSFMLKITFATGPFSSFLICLPVGFYSDRFGRQKIFRIGLFFFVLGAILATFSPSYEIFLLSRLIISLSSGALSVLSGAIIADLFTGKELAKYMGVFAALFPAVFTIAPILGAQLLHYLGWRYIFAFLFISMGLLGLIIGPKLPETRQIKKGTSGDISSLKDRVTHLLKDPQTLILGLSGSLVICIGALFTFNSPFLFIENFGLGPREFSILVASPVFCQFFGALAYRKAVQVIGPFRGLKYGIYPCLILILFISVMLMGYIPQDPYLITGIISLFCFGSTWIISSSVTLLLDATKDDKGLTNSIISLLRNGTIFSVLIGVSYFVDDSIIPVFTTMLILAVVIILLIVFSTPKESTSQ